MTSRAERSDGARARVLGPLVAALAVGPVLGCGYRPVYGGAEARERFHVRLVRTLVTDGLAGQELLAGLREGLAREGALAAGDGWPRAEVELLRADEASEGIRNAGGRPEARGTEVSVVARAWVARGPDEPPERDTGDVDDRDLIAVDRAPLTAGGAPDPRSSAFHQADSLRAAARRLGRRLAEMLARSP
ncbi:MAG: hypothetical protein JOZ69_03450 [Myxococcales bacterium]|nr:hypothetical protein [Myxococcales bacterium]